MEARNAAERRAARVVFAMNHSAAQSTATPALTNTNSVEKNIQNVSGRGETHTIRLLCTGMGNILLKRNVDTVTSFIPRGTAVLLLICWGGT